MLKLDIWIILVLLLLFWTSLSTSKQPSPLTLYDSLVFVSTLRGSFHAISKNTGKIVWSLKEAPVLRIPRGSTTKIAFLPDPKDGSLYAIGNNRDGLKKLPFTIPELVTMAPCKGSDGILYTGFKKDTWIAVDPITGDKLQTLTWDGTEKVCPSSSENTIFIGRTEYTIVLFDSKTRQTRWNATYMDYSSHVAADSGEYKLRHFTASSTGQTVTLDSKTGEVLWQQNYQSPVIAMYTLGHDGLQKIPFMSFAPETLKHLTTRLPQNQWRWRFLDQCKKQVFYPTLYVGESEHGYYAMTSLVDEDTVSIAPKNIGPLLIDGPNTEKESPQKMNRYRDVPDIGASEGVFMKGHHEVPDLSKARISTTHQVAHRPASDRVIPSSQSNSTNAAYGIFKTPVEQPSSPVKEAVAKDEQIPPLVKPPTPLSTDYFVDWKFVTTVLLLMCTMVAVFIYAPRVRVYCLHPNLSS